MTLAYHDAATVVAQEEEEEEEDGAIYKTTFRHFKQTEDFSSVIDFANCDSLVGKVQRLTAANFKNIDDSAQRVCGTSNHFKSYNEWEMYTLKDAVEGLLFIPGVLRSEYRQDWFSYFRDHLPWENDLNLKANIQLGQENIENLRWITFGYHHNWDSKAYALDQCPVIIPDRINDLCEVVRAYLNIGFKAEAGIVNYYNRKSSLCFHTDHSELDHSTPLVSFSLGAPAIFLIGGRTKKSTTPITPILLRDSDLLIMTGESRLALHAIAKIVPGDIGNKKGKTSDKNKIYRINVNVRQVMH